MNSTLPALTIVRYNFTSWYNHYIKIKIKIYYNYAYIISIIMVFGKTKKLEILSVVVLFMMTVLAGL